MHHFIDNISFSTLALHLVRCNLPLPLDTAFYIVFFLLVFYSIHSPFIETLLIDKLEIFLFPKMFNLNFFLPRTTVELGSRSVIEYLKTAGHDGGYSKKVGDRGRWRLW